MQRFKQAAEFWGRKWRRPRTVHALSARAVSDFPGGTFENCCGVNAVDTVNGGDTVDAVDAVDTVDALGASMPVEAVQSQRSRQLTRSTQSTQLSDNTCRKISTGVRQLVERQLVNDSTCRKNSTSTTTQNGTRQHLSRDTDSDQCPVPRMITVDFLNHFRVGHAFALFWGRVVTI